MDGSRQEGQGAVALTVGATLLMVGNALHPLDAAPSAVSRFAFATGPRWILVHLVIAAGMALVGVGLVGLGRGSGRAGRVATTVGAVGAGVMATVFAALDGYGAAAIADRWHAAGADHDVLLGAAVALEAVDTGLAGLGTLLAMGIGMAGVAVALSTEQGLLRWCGRTAAVVAVAGTITGLVLLVAGPTALAINALLRPTAAAMTLLLLVTGGALVRSRGRAVARPRVRRSAGHVGV